jgi:hypothetical protein
MKDGPSGETIASGLERVAVGSDEDGEEITSCIVVPIEGGITKVPLRKKRSAKYDLAIRTLSDLVLEQGKPTPSTWGLPVGVNAVPVDLWRKTMLSQGNIEDDRRRFWDLKQALKRDRLIAERDGLVWLASM